MEDIHVAWPRAKVALCKFSEVTMFHLSMLNAHQINMKKCSGEHFIHSYWKYKYDDKMATLEFASFHEISVVKLHEECDWHNLRREQYKADRTVRQLVDDIRQIESLRAALESSNKNRFNAEVLPLCRNAADAIAEFKLVCSEQNDLPVDDDQHSFSPDTSDLQSSTQLDNVMLLKQESIVKRSSESQKLCHDITQLSEIMVEMSRLVQIQGEQVDSIEGNVTNAQDHLEASKRDLSKVSKLKYAMFPVTGALIGCLAGGPVGLFIGMKVGGAVAIGGGVIGGLGGHLIKKKLDTSENFEMNAIEAKKLD